MIRKPRKGAAFELSEMTEVAFKQNYLVITGLI